MEREKERDRQIDGDRGLLVEYVDLWIACYDCYIDGSARDRGFGGFVRWRAHESWHHKIIAGRLAEHFPSAASIVHRASTCNCRGSDAGN